MNKGIIQWLVHEEVGGGGGGEGWWFGEYVKF